MKFDNSNVKQSNFLVNWNEYDEKDDLNDTIKLH